MVEALYKMKGKGEHFFKYLHETKQGPGGPVLENIHTGEQIMKDEYHEQLEFVEPRIFQDPEVRLIGETWIDMDMIDEINKELGIGFSTDATEDEDLLTEYGGRMCYMSHQENLRRPTDEGSTQSKTYLDHIKTTKHGSVTEHFSYNFLIWDISRNMTHELVRHRVGVAYSQLSGRYVDQFHEKYFGDTGHSVGTYVPPQLLNHPDLYAEWKEHMLNSVYLYYKTFKRFLHVDKLDVKQARGLARNILVGSSGTMMVFTVNCRSLEHIFDMRGSLFAEDEIRRMVVKIFKAIHANGKPNMYSHWEIRTDEKKGEYLARKNS